MSTEPQHQRRAVRARPARHPRRRQLAGARLPRRRRHAALHPARPGRLHVGRRRPALHRLHRLLGPDDPGPRPPGRAGGGAEGRARRLELRRAHRARDRAGRRDHRAGAQRRAGAAGQQRHRGRHERAAPGARRHRPQQDHQVRGLLPRPCRRAAGQGRLGPGDLRLPDQRRRAGRGGAAHAGARIQQPRRSSKRPSPSTATSWPA